MNFTNLSNDFFRWLGSIDFDSPSINNEPNITFTKFDQYFIMVARETAKLSHAQRLKVGAVLVRDNRILLCGYNGTPPGFDNTCEDEFGNTKPEVIHAEENLILYAARKGISTENSTLYITHAPCAKCSNLILGAGIKQIVYDIEYISKSHGIGIPILQKAGVEVIRFE